MSDNDTTAGKKTSLADKAATAAAIIGGAIAAAAVIPQDDLAKKGLPALWESLKGIAHLSWLRLEEAAKKFRPVAFAWGAKLWSIIKWWMLASILLIVGGIEVKARTGSDVSHVLVAAGTISFAGLGLLLFILSDGIASILIFKVRFAGGVLGKAASVVGVDLSKATGLSHEELGKKAMKLHEKIKLVLAGTVVLSFSLLFTMFFPAWSTLGWTLVIWAMVAVALCAAIYLNLEMGLAVKVVFYATLALIVATFVVFLLDRVTGGAIGFAPVQEWLRNINGSEVLAAVLVLIPLSLLLVSAFAKDKDKKSAFRSSAKYVGIGAAVLGAFLLYKGTISWKQLSGKEPPKAVSEVIEKIETASIEGSGKNSGPSGAPKLPADSATTGARYLPPPTGNAAVASSQAPSEPSKAKTQRRAAKPLPKEESKKYSNLTQGMDDLEALGY